MCKWIKQLIFFSSNFTSQKVLGPYTQTAERKKKKECMYNQNTLCGKVIIQNLSRDKAFPRVFPGGTVVKNLPTNAGDMVLIPDLGRSHIQGSSWTCMSWLLSLCSGAWKPWPRSPHATVTEANMPQSPGSAARESIIRRRLCSIPSAAPTHHHERKPTQSEGDPARPKINKQDYFHKKSFPGKHKLKKFITTKQTLKERLKRLL